MVPVPEPLLKKSNKPADRSQDDHKLVLHPEHMDDLMLWKAFRGGDEKALITIFNRFTKALYNYGYKIVSEKELIKDEIQELFIDIWKNRTRLGDTDSIKFYLFTSLRRRLLRVKAKPAHRLFGSLSLKHANETSPSHEFVMIAEQISAEKTSRVMALLGRLTKRQHEALFLRYYEELSNDQIAVVMDLSKQAVYNLFHHALRELKKGVDK